MPIKSYRKAMPAYAALPACPNLYFQPVVEEIQNYPPNMWSVIAGFYTGLKNLVASSSFAGLVIPLLFIIGGAFVIYNQFRPAITEQLLYSVDYYNQGTASPVETNYIADRLKYVSNPGQDYFDIIADSLSTHSAEVPASVQTYAETMYLTIPSLGFNRLPIKPNVESNVKSIYDSVLTSALAHFKGTSLPVSEVPGNTVLYGHSAGGSYNPTPTDVLAAFTFLPNLKVGDLITIEAGGTEYRYRMTKSKIVKPDDTSVLYASGSKDSLTLITCFPAGNNSHRYVAVATPV